MRGTRSHTDRPPLHGLKFWPLLVAVLLLSLGVRLSPFAAARADGGWFLADGDSYYHLRRIRQTIERGGRAPMFDPWLAYPEGQRIQWHAGYDLLVAGAVVLSCGATPDPRCLETTAVLTTPVLGVLATLIVFALGRAVAGTRRGLLAAALFAVYPFAAGSAAIGHVDHHVMEPMFVAAWLWALARGRPAVAGTIAGLSFGIFPSALLPVSTTLAGIGVLRIIRLRRDPSPDWSGVLFASTTALVLLPIVWTGAFSDSWEPAATSRLHLAAVGFAAAGLALIEGVARLWPNRALLAAVCTAAFLGAAILPAAWGALEPLWRFGQSGGLWREMAQQAPWARGHLTAALVIALFTAVALPSLRGAGRSRRAGLQLIAVTALPLTILGVFRMRWLMMAAAPLVVIVAEGLASARAALIRGMRDQPRRTRNLGIVLRAALALLVALPLFEYRDLKLWPDARLLAGARLLARLADPKPALPNGPACVLADWPWGHHVLQFARRPTVASPFVLSGHDRPNLEVRNALASGRPEALEAVMRRRGCDHLLVPSGTLAQRLIAAGGWQLVARARAMQLFKRAPSDG